MADNGHDGDRQFPFPLIESGKGYSRALKSRSQAILNSLTGYLASNYSSSIASTEYSYYLKSVSVELARFTLALEELNTDVSFDLVRSEFIHQVISYFIFVDGDMPDMDLDDEAFRNFLLKIIEIFFQGSTPTSIKESVELFTDQEFEVKEIFKDAKGPNSSHDISSQFEFVVEFDVKNQFPTDVFKLQKNINLIINIVKPAHTLYGLTHVFTDVFKPDDEVMEDEMKWAMSDFRYEDVRKNCQGMSGFESDTGYIETGDLHVLRDDSETAPLASVREGATLTIPYGKNAGHYQVTDSEGINGIRVLPRFSEVENPVTYQVEVDRLGAKKEVEVEEDVSSQFIEDAKLVVDLQGPYSVTQNSPVTITATTNTTQDVEFEWDMNSDGTVDGTADPQFTYQAGAGPDTKSISVKATARDGRQARAYTTIHVLV